MGHKAILKENGEAATYNEYKDSTLDLYRAQTLGFLFPGLQERLLNIIEQEVTRIKEASPLNKANESIETNEVIK